MESGRQDGECGKKVVVSFPQRQKCGTFCGSEADQFSVPFVKFMEP